MKFFVQKKVLFAFLIASLFLVSCKKVDVLVIGGGASGISAGIQASRLGAETLILEETAWVGGMLTSAGVSCIDGNYKMQSGLFGEFCDSLATYYGGWDKLKTGWVSNINFNPRVGQRILTNMANNTKLTIEHQIKLVSVKESKDGWKVIYEDANGKQYRVYTYIIIDGTELGDVAALVGVEYKMGMEANSDTGESIAPDAPNNVIQDLTYVTILKDYGPEADMTIEKPEGYNPKDFANSCLNSLSNPETAHQMLWTPEQMISYGAIPGGYYMINWPIAGNDYYTNVIDSSCDERNVEFDKAKHFTKCFVYFIQTHLGMKNLGIADDIFPTEDNFPLFPYHRESRRIVGETFLTIDAVAKPYEYKYPYYRTGIAVGDYAVDHHHFRHPEWKSLPDLHFYPIPSFNVPMGSMLPQNKENFIVAEKSISVSNIMNGATRLQPVVMQIGQAAGALAALAIQQGVSVKDIKVRQVQRVLLESDSYIMPYLDLPKDDQHFQSLQRIGATGILRGEGRNVGWSNQTWFRISEDLLGEEVYTADYYDLSFNSGSITVGDFVSTIFSISGGQKPEELSQWWESKGLSNYSLYRNITRLEAAVILDKVLNPFDNFEVDICGNLK